MPEQPETTSPAGQQAINDLNQALDAAQGSIESLRACADPPEFVEFEELDARLTGSSLTGTLRRTVPAMTKALAACRTKAETLTRLAEQTSTALGVLGSDEYASAVFNNCVRVFVQSPEFVQAVERIIDNREAQSSSSGRNKRASNAGDDGQRKEPKVTDPVLSELVHFFFHECCNKAYLHRATGHTITSSTTTWPGPTANGKATVRSSAGGVTVDCEFFRPDWNNFDAANSAPFLAEVESRVLSANGGAYAERGLEVKAGIRTYWETVRKTYNRQPGGPNATEGAQQERKRVRHNRSVTSHTSLASAFDRSPLVRCREVNILEEAMSSNKVLVGFFLSADPDHGVRQPPQADFDEWQIYQDMSRGTLAEKNVWLAVDQTWWSEEFRRAYWTLYESVRQSSVAGSYAKSPVFHLPPSKWSTGVSPLPTIRPRTRSGTALPAAAETTWVCPWMVDQNLLNNPDHASFVASLYETPDLDDTMPSLDVLLSTDANLAGIRDAVERHLKALPLLDDEELKRLWELRSSNDISVYKSALQVHYDQAQ